ncbi:MAG: DUF2950 family protein, partial [Bacteroidales bacterium]
MRRPYRHILTAILGLTVFILQACGQAPARTRFETPDDAAKALLNAFKTDNASHLKAIFGPDVEKDFSSGDRTSDRHDRDVMALAMGQSWRWARVGDQKMELVIGDEQWPFPVPLVKVDGGWEFDTVAGREEMVSRRVGRNELRVIELCRAYVLMQQEYASRPRDGKLAGIYAQKLRSTPGRQDGLYWVVGAKEKPSPLGDLMAQAAAEGYDKNKASSQP